MATDTRALIHIPIIHSREDMGSLGQHLPGGTAHHPVAQAHWLEVRRRVQGLGLCWPAVRVYQDGLPDTDPRIIERILAEVESPNYNLLRWLIEQGALVVGTESPSLLKEEYTHLQNVLLAGPGRARELARAAYARRAPGLLAERDAYIARRIAETLRPGETGLLFLGRAHQVAEYLPADLLVRPLFQEDPTAKAGPTAPCG